jgi:hypothetical protein
VVSETFHGANVAQRQIRGPTCGTHHALCCN